LLFENYSQEVGEPIHCWSPNLNVGDQSPPVPTVVAPIWSQNFYTRLEPFEKVTVRTTKTCAENMQFLQSQAAGNPVWHLRRLFLRLFLSPLSSVIIVHSTNEFTMADELARASYKCSMTASVRTITASLFVRYSSYSCATA